MLVNAKTVGNASNEGLKQQRTVNPTLGRGECHALSLKNSSSLNVGLLFFKLWGVGLAAPGWTPSNLQPGLGRQECNPHQR